MEKASVMISMLEAHKSKIRIELSRMASLQDLEALAQRIQSSEQLTNIEVRLSLLEGKMKEFDLTNDDADEEQDEIDSQFMDDIEFSVEKERRRGQSVKTEGVYTEKSGVNSGSRESMGESEVSSLVQASVYKSRGTLGSGKLSSKGGSKRHILMLTRDMSSVNDKIDKLTIDFGATSEGLEKLRKDLVKMQTNYRDMLQYSETVKKEADLMGKRNDEMQVVLEKAASKSRRMKEEINTVIEDFRTESGKQLTRLVNLETEVGNARHEGHSFKIKIAKKFDESIEFMGKLSDTAEKLFREMRGLKQLVGKSEAATQRELGVLNHEIGVLKGPVHEYLQVKGRESEVLNEEVKRHQGLFRKMAEEYISILEVKMKSPLDSTQRTYPHSEEVFRLKQENAHLRAATASPAAMSQLPNSASPAGILRFTSTNFDWEKLRHRGGSLKPTSRPRSRLESARNSFRETPRQLNISIKR
jgi:hypothetical protein